MAKPTQKAAKQAEKLPTASTSKLPEEKTLLAAEEETEESEAEGQEQAVTAEVGNSEEEVEQEEQAPDHTFASLGVIEPLCQACEQLGFKKPTDIQSQSIPFAIQDRDIIGLAQTGSGKTAAFALPILQALWEKPQPLFACVLAPTRRAYLDQYPTLSAKDVCRELAYQISEQFTALGSTIGVRCAVIVGGMDMMSQSIALSKRPHILIATPGRLEDHLHNTKGFSLKSLKYLVGPFG